MTAEACVMNKLGVALAADSAVTLAQPGSPKIYQSADKLFVLSTAGPVAVMVYGAASLLGIPWETIVKRYRKLHGTESHRTVEEHAASFVRFLGSDRVLFPPARQEYDVRGILRSIYSQIRQKMESELNAKIKADGKVAESEVESTLAGLVKQCLDGVRNLEKDRGVPASFPDNVRRIYRRTITSEIDDAFENLPMSRTTRENLRRIASELYTRVWTDHYAGLVVAGFGTDEIFPALVDIQVESVVANRLKCRRRNAVEITDQRHAYIVPFAERQMVYTFMEGIDPGVEEFIARSLGAVLEQLSATFADAVPDLSDRRRSRLRKGLSVAIEKVLQELWQKWEEYRHNNLVEPVMTVVSMLPKDELALLAESLVNLTVLKRRTSIEAETVGGPIDVGVITKGDGFVWIKRKHYSDPALNPRYMASVAPGGRR